MKLLIAFLLALATSSTAAAQSQTVPDTPVVVTVGEGVIKRAPDRAWVTVAAESRAKTPGEAQKANATAMTAVLEKIKSMGFGADTIRTVGYDLNPEIEFVNSRQTIRGYLARNRVEIRVDDFAKLGDVIDVAVGAGATSIGEIRFDLKDRTATEQAALQSAIADARAQADSAAKAAGMRVERIVRIEVHRQGTQPRPIMAMRQEAAFAAPPISPGELEVRVNVTMTSAIR